MRFSRGLVKLPVKQIYLYLVIFSTTLYVCLQIAKYQASRSRTLCRLPLYDKSGARSAHGKPLRLSVCTKLRYRRLNDCPECFRPHAHNISRQLRRVDPNECVSRRQPRFLPPVKALEHKLITEAVMSPSAVCVQSCPYLIVLIPTSAAMISDRNTIRATWASIAKTKLWPYATVNAVVHVIFVMAYPTSHPTYDSSKDGVPLRDLDMQHSSLNLTPVHHEADQYGDVLFLDMVDASHKQTLKLMSAFLWVKVHCLRTRFVLKADMDTFVNIPLLLDLLVANERSLQLSVLGQTCFTYLENHTGSAYVISSEVLTSMLNVSRNVQTVYAEDQDSNPISPDAYVTSYLQTLLNHTALAIDDFLASADDKVTAGCDVIEDRKLVGKVTSAPNMYRIWWGFFRFNAKCGNEENSEKGM